MTVAAATPDRSTDLSSLTDCSLYKSLVHPDNAPVGGFFVPRKYGVSTKALRVQSYVALSTVAALVPADGCVATTLLVRQSDVQLNDRDITGPRLRAVRLVVPIQAEFWEY